LTLFSQRNKFKSVRDSIQIESMDIELRNRLWSLVLRYYLGSDVERTRSLLMLLWDEYYKLPLDTLSNYLQDNKQYIRGRFFNCPWFEVYDFIEFIVKIENNIYIRSTFIKECNLILEEEISGYRFIGEIISPITSEEEIKSIENAIEVAGAFDGVSTHLMASLRMFSDKEKPDYRNSIKESISAVESVCCHIVGEKSATLGSALKAIEKNKNIVLHKSLKGAFEQLYGYTSDAEGIRHKLLDEPTLKFEDAKFMLVACSAFINYLIVKSDKNT